MTAKARIAVVGTGWWACDWHIPAVQENPDAELVAVADIDGQRLAGAAEHYQIARTYDDVDALLMAENLDGVVVATNHVAHYEVTRKCLERNLHVMVEKPMVLKALHARGLVQLAQEQGRELIVGYPWNYYFFNLPVIERLRSGDFGAVQYVYVQHTNHIVGFLEGHDEWMPNKVHGPGSAYADIKLSAGGYGYTQMTHFAGLVCHLSGLRVECVNARMSNQGLEVDLVNAMAVQFEGGALGAVGGTGNVGRVQRGRFGMGLFCERGFIEITAFPVRCQMHSPRYGLEDISPNTIDELDYPGKEPVNNLVDVVLGRGSNRSPGEVGWRATEWLDAAYRSAAEDGRTVYIKELYA
ncbi:MAG: Gfo/Idh/MocA family oxidoreductase [Chloroflexi bacterium]|nr:Gfo/Idh/MocA family oxidoreductase [Chloroflexota bacterium]